MSRELRVTVELGNGDLARLRESVFARTDTPTHELLARQDQILVTAQEYFRAASDRVALDFVRERLTPLHTVIEMLQDKDWTLPGSVQRRCLATLSFLVDPARLAPDRGSVFGHVDEAVVAQILCADIRHELAGYRDFRRFRETITLRRPAGAAADGALLERRLAERRKRIRARIQERRHRSGSTRARALARLRSLLPRV